jgi:hypothetical protein
MYGGNRNKAGWKMLGFPGLRRPAERSTPPLQQATSRRHLSLADFS